MPVYAAARMQRGSVIGSVLKKIVQSGYNSLEASGEASGYTSLEACEETGY